MHIYQSIIYTVVIYSDVGKEIANKILQIFKQWYEFHLLESFLCFSISAVLQYCFILYSMKVITYLSHKVTHFTLHNRYRWVSWTLTANPNKNNRRTWTKLKGDRQYRTDTSCSKLCLRSPNVDLWTSLPKEHENIHWWPKIIKHHSIWNVINNNEFKALTVICPIRFRIFTYT